MKDEFRTVLADWPLIQPSSFCLHPSDVVSGELLASDGARRCLRIAVPSPFPVDSPLPRVMVSPLLELLNMKLQRSCKLRHASRHLAGAMIGICTILHVGMSAGSGARAQDDKDKPPVGVVAKPDDVKSMDAIIASIYDVISGPPGQRDWDRMRSLFLPGARLIPCLRPTQAQEKQKEKQTATIRARVMTVDEFIEVVDPRTKAEGFFEREISRRVERFGAVAHVFSTYESRRALGDRQPFARGINSIQLFFDGQRWWAVTIFWDSERPGQAIPAEYLPK
jgi:hypothetical protein